MFVYVSATFVMIVLSFNIKVFFCHILVSTLDMWPNTETSLSSCFCYIDNLPMFFYEYYRKEYKKNITVVCGLAVAVRYSVPVYVGVTGKYKFITGRVRISDRILID